MKFKFKKYIYLLNDVTNLLLKKDQVKAEEKLQNFRKTLILILILLIASIIFNIYFIYKIYA